MQSGLVAVCSLIENDLELFFAGQYINYRRNGI